LTDFRHRSIDRPLTRRSFLRHRGALGASAAALSSTGGLWPCDLGRSGNPAGTRAIVPDSIPPKLAPGDLPGGYDIYGPRVPVTNVVHDHTSFLATVEAKWNLPALTYRDADAETVMDFLDVERAAFLTPPTIAEPPAPVAAASTT
jgi:hypothetical protein